MMGSFMISSVFFWFVSSVSGLTATPCGDFDSCKIELKKVSSHKMWNDKGSGSNLDFSCWNPDFLDDSYSMLGSIPRGKYGQPCTAYVVKGEDGVFDSPIGYLEIWTDKGTGSVGAGSIWAPKCNQGYRAVGHYCQAGYSMPSVDAMKCVREDLVVPCGHDFVWNDKGSGASTDVSVFVTKDPYGYVSGMLAVPEYTDITGVSCLAGPVIKKGVSQSTSCTPCTSYPSGHTMNLYAGPSKECAAKTLVKGFTQAGKDLLVKTHNELRQKVAAGLETNGNQPKASNMRKISWNDELAEIAQRFVDQCTFGHDKVRNLCDGTYAGQNAFMAWGSEETQDEVMAKVDKPVTSWYSEVEKPFDSSRINPFKWNRGTGHYTQVVWADSHQVGCGLVNYKDGPSYATIINCNYAVGGNMIEGTMYKVGEGCSDCPAGTTCDSTFDKLCA